MNPIVDKETWQEARLKHLAAEKALTQQRDELSRQRRELPWVEITENYLFDTPDGPVSLAELFAGEQQLLVYHFMMGPGWVEGCPSCSFWADNFNGVDMHLMARDTALVAVSRAPIGEIAAYKGRMGWDFRWVSSAPSRFNFDMGVSFDPGDETATYNFGTETNYGEESPGMSAFYKHDDGRIFLTYQTFSRGLDMINGAYHMLDLTALGRHEADLEWSMAWLHRHDAYPARSGPA